MNNSIDYLELIYSYLKKTNNKCSFEDIWNTISKDIPGSNSQSKEDIIGEIYTDLVLDNRFVLTSDGLWVLREYIKYDEIKKQDDYVDKFESTQEFEDIDTDYEDSEKTAEFESDVELEDFDEESDDEDDYGNGDENPDSDLLEEELDLDGETLANKLGITEEIDWSKIEKEMAENN